MTKKKTKENPEIYSISESVMQFIESPLPHPNRSQILAELIEKNLETF